MTFAHDWLLILAAAPIAWCAWGWRRSYRRLGLLLKTAALVAIVLALAEPQQKIAETYAAVAVLSDVSASIPQEQRARQQSFVGRARGAGGGHSLRPMEFGARAARSLADGAAGRSTNIESALRDSMSALPPDRVPRIVLLSDGLANEGAVERAVFEARRRGVPVDTVALAGRQAPQLSLEAVTMPAQAFVGERFPIDLTVRSPSAATASVELRAEGKTIGESVLRLPAGEGPVTVRARLDIAGSALIEGTLRSPAHGEARFAGAVSLRRPRALLITGDGGAAAAPLAGVLTSSGFDLQQAGSASILAEDARAQYDVIVAANENFEAWSEKAKASAEHFVREGGGFLLIAGERNLYREPEEAEEDILQAMLPAKLAPPRLPEGIAVVLVVDKSSSMEGKKMQLARQSALGVVENLRVIDKVGVLAFDNSFEWAVPLQRNEFPAATKKLISGIIADGGTQIAPALHEAYRLIKPQQTVYKHVLLLTDGISEEGDSIALAREAAMNAITISTIGLGQDVNRSYLERVANSAEGKSYFLLDISALEQIVLRDVMEHTGSSVTEKEFTPIADRSYEILADLDLAEPGPLLGWVKFEAKPEADTILRVDDEDPLLVRWQYGLGRSVVFASDAKDRWAANWVAWDGFDRFWANVIRDILPRSSTDGAVTEYDEASDEIVVRYRAAAGSSAAASPPELYALGPDGYRQARLPERDAEGYTARFPAEGRFGLFRIRPASDAPLFPETAHYRENSELSEYGADVELMQTIAAATGGRFNPAPEEIFDTQGKAVERRMDLWPLLLALAIMLNLIELLARKGWLPVLGRWA